jgi:hypothetical protein
MGSEMSAEEVRRGMRELGVRKDSNKAAEGMFNFNFFFQTLTTV